MIDLQSNFNTFGLTHDQARIDAAHAYREALAADGWTLKAASHSGSEGIDRWCHATRNGFTAHILSRPIDPAPKSGNGMGQASVCFFGPDHGWVPPPVVYNWDHVVLMYKFMVRVRNFKLIRKSDHHESSIDLPEDFFDPTFNKRCESVFGETMEGASYTPDLIEKMKQLLIDSGVAV